VEGDLVVAVAPFRIAFRISGIYSIEKSKKVASPEITEFSGLLIVVLRNKT